MDRVGSKIITLMLGMGALPLALSAATPPALQISDGMGDSVVVDSTGTATCMGSCTTIGVSVTPAGKILWKGILGPFGIPGAPISITGESKPLLGPPPSEDLNISANTFGSGGSTLTVQWSDTNFTPSVVGGTLTVGGNVNPGSATSMTYSGYFDNTNSLFGTGTLVATENFPNPTSGSFGGTASGSASATPPFAMTEVATISLAASSQVGVDFQFIATPAAGTPQLTVVKTADSGTITAGSTAGFTITISNPGSAPATGVRLSDPLPAGAGSDIDWMIDTTTGNPTCFTISGAVGSQVLTLNASCSTLNAGASLSVHITGLTHADDVGSASTNPALNVGGVSGYTVLYEGTGGHNLSITNVSIGGNVGVGGTAHVQFSGPGTITGRLDFSAPNTGQFSNSNGSNVGPTSVNYNVAAVTMALNAINSLSSSLGGLAGTNIAINGNMTLNESAGALQTVGTVTYRVFNVTSYSENDGKVVTINGDGSGDPVVLNFLFNSNVNLGGDVVLTNGLTPDQVIWNFASTNSENIQINNNQSSFPYPAHAFQGVILAPNDKISAVNTSLIGRLYGGDSQDMQIVSGDTIHTPPGTGNLPNTATVSGANVSGSVSATATITIQ